MPRTLEELVNLDDPGWPIVQEWVASATNHVEVLPPVAGRGGEELVRLQVTTRSPMGAVTYESGGLLVDHGWLRVLGSGHPRLPRPIAEWNEERTGSVGGAGFILVADDAVGGFFAVNGGALPGPPGSVAYLAPDTVAWESLDTGYSGFLEWCLQGDLQTFYQASRWEGWEQDMAALQPDNAFSVVPPLWAAGPPIGERSRRGVSVAELYGIAVDLAGKRAQGGGDADAQGGGGGRGGGGGAAAAD